MNDVNTVDKAETVQLQKQGYLLLFEKNAFYNHEMLYIVSNQSVNVFPAETPLIIT